MRNRHSLLVMYGINTCFTYEWCIIYYQLNTNHFWHFRMTDNFYMKQMYILAAFLGLEIIGIYEGETNEVL